MMRVFVRGMCGCGIVGIKDGLQCSGCPGAYAKSANLALHFL